MHIYDCLVEVLNLKRGTLPLKPEKHQGLWPSQGIKQLISVEV